MNYSNSQRAGVILNFTALLFGAYLISQYLLVIETDEDVNNLYPELAKIVTKYLGEVVDFISTKKNLESRLFKGIVHFIKVSKAS